MSFLCWLFSHRWVWSQSEHLFGAGYSGYVWNETSRACSRCGTRELLTLSFAKKYPSTWEPGGFARPS